MLDLLVRETRRPGRSGDDLILVTEQVFEEVVFSAREIEDGHPPDHSTGEKIHLQVIGPKHPLPHREVAAEVHAKPGQEIGECEGLHEMVICPAVETQHLVLDGVSRREDQDRSGEATRPQFPQHVESVSTVEHKIQDDGTNVVRAGGQKPFLSGRGGDDHLPLRFEAWSQAGEVLSYDPRR